MLLISIGFDPHWRDPLGHLSLTAAGYGELIRSMAVWSELNCSNRMALFLEGGYDLDAGAACLQATVAALLGLEWTDYLGSPPRPEGNSWRTILREAHRIWKI
jgi:acetoin utilization deacetylase AcuC-like enzyme